MAYGNLKPKLIIWFYHIKKNNEKIEAIKAQLKFRKEVLNQIPDDKTVFNVTKAKQGSKSRKQLSTEELIINLKDLVKQSIVKDTMTETERHLLVGKRIKHRFMIDGTEKWYHGKVISQVIINSDRLGNTPQKTSKFDGLQI